MQYLLGAIGAGVVLTEILSHLPVSKPAKRRLAIAAGLLSLAGGLALRLAFVAAGNEPDLARLATGERGGTGGLRRQSCLRWAGEKKPGKTWP